MGAFDANVGVARHLIEEAWNKGNLEVIDEYCTDDCVDHDQLAGDQDREGMKGTITAYRAAFPDLNLTIEDCFACEDKVVTRWTGTGTFQNEFLGREPTGEMGTPIKGISIDRFEDGKVVESWGCWDSLTLMRNIGAVTEKATVQSAT